MMLTPEQITWIDRQLETAGYSRTGAIAVSHERAWSTVATVPASTGNLYFKLTRPELTFEVRLATALHTWGMPVPAVVGAEPEKGWLLMAGSGQSMRSLLQADGDIRRWHRAVTRYARMQIALIHRAGDLLALGVFDRRLDRLPALLGDLLQDRPAMLIGQEGGLTPAEYRELRHFLPRFAGLCRQLAAYGIPETLHHDDFHDNNIYVEGDRYTFADWGEACVAHPFFSMIIVLRIAAYILKLETDDPALAALRDVYLQQWRAYGTPAELLAAFELAQVIGAANRALTWHELLAYMNEEERAAEADSVPGWLHVMLASPPVSGASAGPGRRQPAG